MIDVFNREWKKSRDKDRAREKAELSLNKCIEKMQITNDKAIIGLRAELLYYYYAFQEQSLRPESAAGLHADFTGNILGKNAVIDVTTAPHYKNPDEYLEVKEAFGNNWDYYIGVVDLKNEDIEKYPLLLPRCEDGNRGHFVLVLFDSDSPTFEGQSDYQMLLKYNPYAYDDDASLEKVVQKWDYMVTSPAYYHKYMEGEARYDESYDPSEAKIEFDQFGAGLAYGFRKESGVVISAVACVEQEYFKPAERVDWVTRLYWVHPHYSVRKSLGNPLDDLPHNVGGVAYGF